MTNESPVNETYLSPHTKICGHAHSPTLPEAYLASTIHDSHNTKNNLKPNTQHASCSCLSA